jgi:hypothetical protein
MKGNTATLCVRRATYFDPELGRDDPAKKGVCSNFLCDAKPGDEVMLTGPAGKVMLMPESNPNADIIMIATGTGIAPYRYVKLSKLAVYLPLIDIISIILSFIELLFAVYSSRTLLLLVISRVLHGCS